MLTEVTGRPALLIRRLPNRLILMSAVYTVYDVPQREATRRALRPEFQGICQVPR